MSLKYFSWYEKLGYFAGLAAFVSSIIFGLPLYAYILSLLFSSFWALHAYLNT